MVDLSVPRARYGEVFWRAHHEAWKRSDFNQRQNCEADGLSPKSYTSNTARLRAFGHNDLQRFMSGGA